MIRNLLTNIYITSRLLVSMGAVASAFYVNSLHIRAIIISFTFLYFSLALLSYYKLKLGHYINKYLDVIYFAGFFSFANPYTYPLSTVSVTLLSPRQARSSFVLTLESLVFDIYKVHQDIPFMIFLGSLQIGILTASMCPDIISALKKERHKIVNLRIAYKDMLRHLDSWEKSQRQSADIKFLLQKALETKDLEGLLESIKERLDINDIKIMKVDKNLPYDIKRDYKNGNLYITIPKEGFSLTAEIELLNPIDLYNGNLILTLEYLLGICSFYYMDEAKEKTLSLIKHEVA